MQSLARLVLAVALTVLIGVAARAQPPPVAETDVRALEALDGDTLRLTDGRILRLLAIQAPKPPLGRAPDDPWPLAEAARTALAEAALGSPLQLAYEEARFDRHGRLLAHLFDASGEWIQSQLLAAGLARVYGLASARAGLDELLAVERQARAQRRGLWADSFYRVLTPEATERRIGSYQLVEGRVLRVAVVRRRAYLNFGDDWRTDFTVSLAPRVRRLFEREEIDVTAYEGRLIRVRGWLQSINGPMIEATHPEQIEVIE